MIPPFSVRSFVHHPSRKQSASRAIRDSFNNSSPFRNDYDNITKSLIFLLVVRFIVENFDD